MKGAEHPIKDFTHGLDQGDKLLFVFIPERDLPTWLRNL